LQRGDVIGLLMENKAKYMAYIIGLAKIGVTVALINFHLKEEVRKAILAFDTEISSIKYKILRGKR
jgi:acyl-CoA synthetase (AMP-forming)/AMP-acid ligase II